MTLTRRYPSAPRLIIALASALLVLVLGTALADAQQSQPLEGGELQVDDDDGVLRPGQTFGIYGGGFAPGAEVTLTLNPGGHDLGRTTTAATGELSADVTLPVGLAPGDYTLDAAGADAAGGLRVLSAELSVAPGPGDPDFNGPGFDGPGVDDDDDTRGSLPRTGGDVAVLALAGAALVGVGGAVLYARRRVAGTA